MSQTHIEFLWLGQLCECSDDNCKILAGFQKQFPVKLLEEGPENNITQQKENKENALPVCGKGAKQGKNN